MPITRDLSVGKRVTLQLWIYTLSMDRASTTSLSVNSIPPGWAPPSPSKPSK